MGNVSFQSGPITVVIFCDWCKGDEARSRNQDINQGAKHVHEGAEDEVDIWAPAVADGWHHERTNLDVCPACWEKQQHLETHRHIWGDWRTWYGEDVDDRECWSERCTYKGCDETRSGVLDDDRDW